MKVRPINDPDCAIDLQQGLDIIMARATARLNEAGFRTTDVLVAWDDTLNNHWNILEEDPEEPPATNEGAL